MTITAVGSQEGGVTQDSASAVSRAFGSNVAAGNLIVVLCFKDIGGSAFVAGDCTKSAGTATVGTITLDKELRFDLGGGSDQVAVGAWSCLVTGAGSCTMQVSSAAGTYFGLGTGEYNATLGWDASRLEATNTGSSATDNWTAGDTGNGTSAGGALFMGVLASNGSSSKVLTPDASFTQIFEQEDASLHIVGSTQRRIVSSGTTDAANWTLEAGSGWRGYAAALAVYKEVAPAAGIPIARLFYPEYKFFMI